MAHIWKGLIAEYSDFMPEYIKKDIVTLKEGNTPLIPARKIAEQIGKGVKVYVKFDGANPTGSFKDRGMTAAISAAKAKGVKTVICASTGNTSAAAAAFASQAGMRCIILIPDGNIAMGKLAQSLAYGGEVLAVDGNFDDCLEIVREVSKHPEIELVNSINPARMEGQKTAAFEIIDDLELVPDIHCIPVGNAGNITAYWKGYNEYNDAKNLGKLPKMWGFQAAGAAPLVNGEIEKNPETIATAIRIGNPVRADDAKLAVANSGGMFDKVTDKEILEAQALISSTTGIFCEPASAASVAGLLKNQGKVPENSIITCTLTGNGLKDPSWAYTNINGDTTLEPVHISADLAQISEVLGVK
jgi:threonine synthase